MMNDAKKHDKLEVPLQFGVYVWGVFSTALFVTSILLTVAMPHSEWPFGIVVGGIATFLGFPMAWFSEEWY
jgi:hypothetical protein